MACECDAIPVAKIEPEPHTQEYSSEDMRLRAMIKYIEDVYDGYGTWSGFGLFGDQNILLWCTGNVARFKLGAEAIEILSESIKNFDQKDTEMSVDDYILMHKNAIESVYDFAWEINRILVILNTLNTVSFIGTEAEKEFINKYINEMLEGPDSPNWNNFNLKISKDGIQTLSYDPSYWGGPCEWGKPWGSGNKCPCGDDGGPGFGNGGANPSLILPSDPDPNIARPYNIPASPIILDLNGDGVKTIGVEDGVHFDHDGNRFAGNYGDTIPISNK